MEIAITILFAAVVALAVSVYRLHQTIDALLADMNDADLYLLGYARHNEDNIMALDRWQKEACRMSMRRHIEAEFRP